MKRSIFIPTTAIRRSALVLIASLLVASPADARTVSITAENYKSVSARQPVLVYMSLGCDMGSYASELFQNAFYDLEGVDLAVFDANQGYKITDGKPYDLGSMVVLYRGKAVATTKETYPNSYLPLGFNNEREWAFETFKRLGIPFSMAAPEPSWVSPTQDTGAPVDLNRGLMAIYTFSDLSDSSKQQSDFDVEGHAKISNGLFVSDGFYDAKSGGQFRSKKSAPYSEGFTVSVNVKLNPSKEDRRQIMTVGYRLFDVGIYKNVLNVRTNISGEEAGKNVYAHEYYEVPGFKVEDGKWYNIILSGNLQARRIALMINGKRFDDIQLTSRFVTYYKRFYKDRMGAYLALQFFNYGWGGVLDGYADNLVVYERGLNGAEMTAFHTKYGGEFSDVTVTPTNNSFTEKEKKAYFAAVVNGELDSVQGFLRRGMPVDEQWYGWTGLMLAAYYGQTSIVSELIERKADVSVKVDGWDAYQLAKARNHPRVAALLNNYLNTERFYFQRSVHEIKHRSILKPPLSANQK